MKFRSTSLIFIFLIGSLILTSCGSSISATSWPGVTIKDDTVYVAYSTGVFAVKASNGQMVWRYPAEAKNTLLFYSEPLAMDGQIIVGNFSNELFALDPQAGTEKWSYKGAKDRWVAGASLAGDTIIAPNADYNTYAFDSQGTLKWKFAGEQAFWAAAVSDGKTVFIPSMDHHLYAVDLQSGAQKWAVDVNGSLVASALLAEDGTLYVGSLANEVTSISGNGQINWTFPTEKEIWGTPALKDGIVYVGDMGGKIYAIDAATGSSKWTIDAEGAVIGSGAVIPNGVVFANEDGKVFLLNAEGVKEWTQTITGKLYGKLVVSDELIIVPVTGGDNLLVAFDFNGAQKWAFTLPK